MAIFLADSEKKKKEEKKALEHQWKVSSCWNSVTSKVWPRQSSESCQVCFPVRRGVDSDMLFMCVTENKSQQMLNDF